MSQQGTNATLLFQANRTILDLKTATKIKNKELTLTNYNKKSTLRGI